MKTIKRTSSLLLLTIVMIIAACGVPSDNPAPDESLDPAGENTPIHSLTPFFVEDASSGRHVPADWGRVFVPEDRTKSDSRMIEVPFVRFKAAAENPGTPVFFLEGGPGDTPTTLQKLEQFLPTVELVTGTSDLILMEQRGIGHARPSLDCPGSYSFPLDKPASLQSQALVERSFFEDCARFWEDQGVHISGYNVREMAADVDAIRQALGYDKISLIGGSFGSHHAIAVLKEYGENIELAVLTMVEGPNHTIKLPSVVQQHLENLDARVKADPELSQQIPDFLSLVETVHDQLEREPATVEVTDPETGELVFVTVGKLDLQQLAASELGRIGLRALPARYLAMSQGDFSWLAGQALDSRLNIKRNLMPRAVDCASGASADRLALLESETDGTLLGNGINGISFDVCDAVGSHDLGDAFRTDLETDVPVLMISGDMDARTPVSNAEEVLQGLPNGQHVIVEGASHSMFQEAAPQIIPIIAQFMGGDPYEPLASAKITAPFEFEAVQ